MQITNKEFLSKSLISQIFNIIVDEKIDNKQVSNTSLTIETIENINDKKFGIPIKDLLKDSIIFERDLLKDTIIFKEQKNLNLELLKNLDEFKIVPSYIVDYSQKESLIIQIKKLILELNNDNKKELVLLTNPFIICILQNSEGVVWYDKTKDSNKDLVGSIDIEIDTKLRYSEQHSYTYNSKEIHNIKVFSILDSNDYDETSLYFMERFKNDLIIHPNMLTLEDKINKINLVRNFNTNYKFNIDKNSYRKIIVTNFKLLF